MNEEEQVVEEKTEADRVASKSGPKFKMGPKRTLRVVIVVIVVLIIIYLIKVGTAGGANVATVNGENISKAELDTRVELVISSSQVQGLDVTDPILRAQLEDQVLNELINTRLLLQGAANAGLSVSSEEVDEQYQIIIAQFGSEELVRDTLKESGVTIKELKKNVEEQILINAFINAQTGVDGIIATEEEIAAIYDRNAALQDNMPPLEVVRSQIEAQIIAEKTQQLGLTLIDQLRSEATIELPEENDEDTEDGAEEDAEEETTEGVKDTESE